MDKFQEKSEVVAAILAVISAERKKIITMGLLLCVMGFMWSKVLSGKKEQQAAIETKTTAAAKENIKISLTYVPLPSVQGRNDRIKNDFFSPESFLGFNPSAGTSNTISPKKDDNDIQFVMKNIRIDAILSGENPQVFINDQLLNVGDKLKVEKSGTTYELELVKITKDKIQLKYGGTVVETGMADSDNEK